MACFEGKGMGSRCVSVGIVFFKEKRVGDTESVVIHAPTHELKHTLWGTVGPPALIYALTSTSGSGTWSVSQVGLALGGA